MTTPRDPAPAPSTVDVDAAWTRLLREWSAAGDYPALLRLSRRADRLAGDPRIAERLVPLRIGLASSATIDFVVPVLKTALLASGILPVFHLAPYGQVTVSLLDGQGPLAQFAPQVTVVVHAAPHVPRLTELTDTIEDVERRVDDACRELLAPCEMFHQRTGSEIVLTNFHPLPWRAAGNVGARLPGDPTSFMRRLNLAVSDRAPRYVHVFDVASLAERVGVEHWFDERYWHLAKQPLSFESVPVFSRTLAAVIGGLVGRVRKCVVVDLDNTLWGGVIGDDGLAIQIGEGSAEGEAFKAFQQYLRDLKGRGILLAVCSKNEDATARSAFLEHPDMVLRLDDFAAFKANWQPKSDNIRAIARELDLPLDAFVFVDDNPAERDEVARAIPEIAVPPLPDDPSQFVRALDVHHFFETPSLTDEDLQRTTAYVARRRSREELSAATDVGAYLASLEMTASVESFTPSSFERITQLVNKTNQFNLTTPRLLQADIERMAADPSMVTRTVRLKDRLGDHGLISVLFGRIEDRQLFIDAWLMSCRVFGRGVEALLFNDLLRTAAAREISELIGFYRPTKKNVLVKDHYARLGFSRDPGEDGTERWRLSVADAKPMETHIALAAPALTV
jgi:FkbH-like protein